MDFLRTRRELLNGTDVELVFYRASDDFVILKDTEIKGWMPKRTAAADWPKLKGDESADDKKKFLMEEIERLYKERLYKLKSTVEANEAPQAGYTPQTRDENKYKYELDDLCLHVTKLEPSEKLLAYNNARVRHLPARYLIQEWEMSMFILPPGLNRIRTTSLFGNRVPTKTVYALVTLDQERGTQDTNPEILTHYNLRRFVQRIGGRPSPPD